MEKRTGHIYLTILYKLCKNKSKIIDIVHPKYLLITIKLN